MTKKILVCGAAGFLMSNFVRYILYADQSKEYRLINIDDLSASTMKSVYINRNNERAQFYLGNVNDDSFMNNIIENEKPDIIINGIHPKRKSPNIIFDQKKVLDGLLSLAQHNIPIIQLGWPEEVDIYGLWNLIRQVVIRDLNGTYLAIPNCFGMRQRGGFANHIREIMEFNKSLVCEQPLPWVYAENVCSLIWFLIENGIKGQVKMPPLDWCNLERMTRIISSALNLSPQVIGSSSSISSYNNSFWEPMVVDYRYEGSIISEWEPDYKNIEGTLAKTAQWYNANRWFYSK